MYMYMYTHMPFCLHKVDAKQSVCLLGLSPFVICKRGLNRFIRGVLNPFVTIENYGSEKMVMMRAIAWLFH